MAASPRAYLLLAVATLGLGGYLNYSAHASVEDMSAHLDKLRGDAQDEHQIKQSLAEAIKKRDECAASLKHLEVGVPDLAYVPTLLKELELTGNACGIEVSGVRPIVARKPKGDEKEEKKPYDEEDIEVKGHGNYASVMAFVSKLETFPKIVAARMISLTPRPDAQVKGLDTLDVEIDLRAYVFPPSAGEKMSTDVMGGTDPKSTAPAATAKPAPKSGGGI